MWRFWNWPRPPMDPLVAMALLVRGCDRETPTWKQITITRRADGGAVLRVD